jgi:hypothetical protein
MSFARVTGLTVGFAAAFAIGVWTGPRLLEHSNWSAWRAPQVAHAEGQEVPSATVDVPTAKPAVRRERAAVSATPVAVTVPVSAPALQSHLKPLLMSGSNMAIAADGFATAEQFAAVAHAARNTGVPFVLLKDRVLNRNKSLAAAIKEFKPALDSADEASRARAQAREDVAMVGKS